MLARAECRVWAAIFTDQLESATTALSTRSVAANVRKRGSLETRITRRHLGVGPRMAMLCAERGAGYAEYTNEPIAWNVETGLS